MEWPLCAVGLVLNRWVPAKSSPTPLDVAGPTDEPGPHVDLLQAAGSARSLINLLITCLLCQQCRGKGFQLALPGNAGRGPPARLSDRARGYQRCMHADLPIFIHQIRHLGEMILEAPLSCDDF